VKSKKQSTTHDETIFQSRDYHVPVDEVKVVLRCDVVVPSEFLGE